MSNQTEKVITIITDAESRTCTFTKTYVIRGHNKTGTFTFKYPSLFDRAQIGIARAKMLDGATERSLDGISSDITYMIAYLGKLVVKAPAWFNLMVLDEMEVLQDLFDEVSKWVNNFRDTTESSDNEGHSTPSNIEKVVDGNEDVPRSNNS